MILVTFTIYISAARTIFKIRKQVHELNSDYDLNSFTSAEVTTVNETGTSTLTGGGVVWTHTRLVYQQTTTVRLPQRGSQNAVQPGFVHRRRSYEHKNAAWSYTKCALLYFTAILITWIPASANRVFSLVHNGEAYAPVAYMSAIVLPLQGFWNWIIYVVMSWTACKKLAQDIKAKSFAMWARASSTSGPNRNTQPHQ